MPSTVYRLCHRTQFWKAILIDKLSLRSILELCCLRPRKLCQAHQPPSELLSHTIPLWSRYLLTKLATIKRKRICRHLHHLEPSNIWKTSTEKNWASCKWTSLTKRALIASKLPRRHVQRFHSSTTARSQALNPPPPKPNQAAWRQTQATPTLCSTKSATSAVRQLAVLTKFLSAWSVMRSDRSFPKFSSTWMCIRGTSRRRRAMPPGRQRSAWVVCRRVSSWDPLRFTPSNRNHSNCRVWGTYLLGKQWLKNFEAEM